MGKWALAAAAVVPLLLLGYCKLPSTSCTATWRDVEGKDLAAPVDVCRHEPNTRAVGGLAFAHIGEHVYRVDQWERRQPGGPVCMIGVACFPLYERPRNEREWRLVRLEGPVDFARLRSYLDDRILSDGSAVFDTLKRVSPLEPALDLAQLRVAFQGDLGAEYVTDGRWVLYGGQVMPGADPSTLEAVPFAFISSGANSHAPAFGGVVRDRHAVFFRRQRIEGADPASGTCRTTPPSRSGSVRSATGTCARNSHGCSASSSSNPSTRCRTNACQRNRTTVADQAACVSRCLASICRH
jgi:hypothetical protein